MNFGPQSFGEVRGIAFSDCMDGKCKMHAKLLLLREESKNGLVFYWFQPPLIFVLCSYNYKITSEKFCTHMHQLYIIVAIIIYS